MAVLGIHDANSYALDISQLNTAEEKALFQIRDRSHHG